MDNAVKYGFRWSNANGGRNMPQPLEELVVTSQAFAVNGGAAAPGLGIGDPVIRLSTGGVTLADGTEGAGGAVNIYAVVVGVKPYYDATFGRMTPSNVLPSAVAYGTNLERQSKVLVVPVGWGLWDVDVDDATTATTLAAYQLFIGENADHILTGVSGQVRAFPKLDISGHGTSNALHWRIVRVSPTQENQDFSGANVKLTVAANVAQGVPYTATGV